MAFSVLFLYMWKDLAAFYSSVWFYISWLQHREGGILTNIVDAAKDATSYSSGATEDAKQ